MIQVDVPEDAKEYGDKKREFAPHASTGLTNIMLSVLLEEGEDVEWLWTYIGEGSYVSGYVIRRNGRIVKRS